MLFWTTVLKCYLFLTSLVFASISRICITNHCIPSCNPSPDNALLELICHGFSFNFSKPKALKRNHKTVMRQCTKWWKYQKLVITRIKTNLQQFSRLTKNRGNRLYLQRTESEFDDSVCQDVLSEYRAHLLPPLKMKWMVIH